MHKKEVVATILSSGINGNLTNGIIKEVKKTLEEIKNEITRTVKSLDLGQIKVSVPNRAASVATTQGSTPTERRSIETRGQGMASPSIRGGARQPNISGGVDVLSFGRGMQDFTQRIAGDNGSQKLLARLREAYGYMILTEFLELSS